MVEQLVVQIGSGIILLLLELFVQLWFRWRRPAIPAERVTEPGAGMTVSVGRDLRGSVTANDNRQYTTNTFTQNVAASAPSPPSGSETTDDGGRLVLYLILMIVGAAAFVAVHEIVLGALVGACTVVAVLLLIALRGARVADHKLPAGGRLAVVRSIWAVAVGVAVWFAVESATWSGRTVDTIRAPTPISSSESGFIASIGDALEDQLSWMSGSPESLVLAAVLGVATVCGLLSVLLGLMSVTDLLTYARFRTSTTSNPLAHRRVARLEGDSWELLLAPLILGVLALVLGFLPYFLEHPLF